MIKSFLYYINNILGNIDESPFWSNFISNLLVAVPFGMLLPKWITHSKRPKRLEFYFTENGTDVLNLSKNNSESFNYNIELGIRHSSGSAFEKTMFWHIYIPEFINSKAEPLENKNSLPISKKELNNNYIYTHYSGKIKEELFPQTNRAFWYRFSGRFKLSETEIIQNKKTTIYYFFSTEFGNFPKTVSSNRKTGNIKNLKSLGKLYINIK